MAITLVWFYFAYFERVSELCHMKTLRTYAHSPVTLAVCLRSRGPTSFQSSISLFAANRYDQKTNIAAVAAAVVAAVAAAVVAVVKLNQICAQPSRVYQSGRSGSGK